MKGFRSIVRKRTQSLLTRIGAQLSTRHVHSLNAAVNYLEVGRWLAANGFESQPRYPLRAALHTAIGGMIADKHVLYLEFGVFGGASLRHWVTLLRNPRTELHGFDSFEGLPEDWDAQRKKGTFDQGGRMPVFDDNRVSLHKGWFNETLPQFALPPHEQLVIHIDADLYSSTDYVLKTLERHFRVGTIMMFDEFCDRFHELLAFDQYLKRTGHKYRFLGATANLEQVVFQRVG